MTRRAMETRTGRALFAALMLLALAMRVAIPAGFMPAATGEGVTVLICTGDGMQARVIPVAGQHSDGAAPKGGQGACTFAAALGSGITSQAQSIEILLPFPVFIAIGAAIADLTVHRLAAPPPPSQGPPART